MQSYLLLRPCAALLTKARDEVATPISLWREAQGSRLYKVLTGKGSFFHIPLKGSQQGEKEEGWLQGQPSVGLDRYGHHLCAFPINIFFMRTVNKHPQNM